ncbi:SH3 domain-containing protein [Roseibium sp. RKSG952]|uniref:SH3 domain-containing protein n=1 Tax=Roseibium sp. RKSG952 TaxID=2529384 RepID=UPI0012BC8F88|nr:SH3 domain-containing protein [Roseibium sp. RKSG952]MTH98980.1 SH3 domain-containing protein [Roseibium sp. RKSG952]
MRNKSASKATANFRSSQSGHSTPSSKRLVASPGIRWADDPGPALCETDLPGRAEKPVRDRTGNLSLKLLGTAAVIAVTATGAAVYAAKEGSPVAPRLLHVGQTIVPKQMMRQDHSPETANFAAIDTHFDIAAASTRSGLEEALKNSVELAQLRSTNSPDIQLTSNDVLRTRAATIIEPETSAALAFTETPSGNDDAASAILAATAADPDNSTPQPAAPATGALLSNNPDPASSPSSNRSGESAALPSAPGATVTASVNMRASADSSSQVVAILPAEARVLLDSCDSWWCSVSYDGKTGYVSKQFVSGHS